jgi:hypothetical protein
MSSIVFINVSNIGIIKVQKLYFEAKCNGVRNKI